MLQLCLIKNSHSQLRAYMREHYSRPKGFVGRNLCYLIYFGETCYGAIVAGSAIMHLKGRDQFFALEKETKKSEIQKYANNTFFHIERVSGRYPCRNFGPRVLKMFRERIAVDWPAKYGTPLLGFESLVELPRTGEMYLRDGWQEVGTTKGQTCKRIAGKGTDKWPGKRVWNTTELRPKRVLCRLP